MDRFAKVNANVLLILATLFFSHQLAAESHDEAPRVNFLKDFDGIASIQTKESTVLHVNDKVWNSNTVFWIGSVSKQFLAVAVLRLVEQNQIQLDSGLDRYLDWDGKPLKFDGVSCTVRQILNHTCGLPDGLACYTLDTEVQENANRLLECAHEQTLKFKPGSSFLYSNLGYDLLGILVQKTTGKKYSEFMETHFFTVEGVITTSTNVRGTTLDFLSKRIFRP